MKAFLKAVVIGLSGFLLSIVDGDFESTLKILISCLSSNLKNVICWGFKNC